MTHRFFSWFGLLCCCLLQSCLPTASQRGNVPDTTLSVYDRAGAATKVVSSQASDFFITVEAPAAWTLTLSEPDGWAACSPDRGETGRQDVAVAIAPNEGGQRSVRITLSCGDEERYYTIIQQQTPGHEGGTDPDNPDYGDETILGDVSLLECPKLSGRNSAYYITHRVEQGQRVNYSVEYDVLYRHPIWVCYSADAYTAQRNTSRSDAWAWDPFVPSRYEVVRSDFNGYNRGHMVASADRLFSEEANVQTFYYTNMSPQRGAHNTGVWLQLEQLVQEWARNNRLRDRLYVVKGGTLREGETIDKTSGGISVPKYYWMAVLLEREGKYRAIAFWTEHLKPQTVSRPRSLAIPVDVLEQRTGLDLFHNLPDEIETVVEAAQPARDPALWPGI